MLGYSMSNFNRQQREEGIIFLRNGLIPFIFSAVLNGFQYRTNESLWFDPKAGGIEQSFCAPTSLKSSVSRRVSHIVRRWSVVGGGGKLHESLFAECDGWRLVAISIRRRLKGLFI